MKKVTMMTMMAVAITLGGCFHAAKTEQGIGALIVGVEETLCRTKLAETERQMLVRWGQRAMTEREEFCAAVEAHANAEQES